MAIDKTNYSAFLEKVADGLDIPPSKHQKAVEHYRAVGSWLECGDYADTDGTPRIYPQGSFRLGTVVKPIRNSKDAEYDIDLVCELPIPKGATDPASIKAMVGDRLRESPVYGEKMDREGKRCWKLNYAAQDGLRFHLDALPAVPDAFRPGDKSIAITNKLLSGYEWSDSNPEGYAEWFEGKNREALNLVKAEQKQSIQALLPTVYASVDDVPDELVRTPLRRSIQILKRHRDMMFNDSAGNQYQPISMIITTLAAHFYRGETDVFSALRGVITQLAGHSALIKGGQLGAQLTSLKLIQRTSDGGWYIANPVNEKENFADRWHEDNHARARAFFQWVERVKRDLIDILHGNAPETVRSQLTKVLGATVVSGHLGLVTLAAGPPTPPAPVVHIPRRAPQPWRP